MTNPLTHAFSVDVEDWYQSSFNLDSPISPVCVKNTRKILDFLSEWNVKGTFFIQGSVGRAFPEIVRDIHSMGHEVQSHGYSHKSVFSMTPDEFRGEILETKKILEDITGEEVTGFRAPDFSIDMRNMWALEVLVECGIKYDSSIFPMKTFRYGVNGFPLGYTRITTPSGSIEEIPVTVIDVLPRGLLRVPLGGGGYFRLFPSFIIERAIKFIERKNVPFVIYCHPYEFNPMEWQEIKKRIPLHRKVHQGLGRKTIISKFEKLFSRFSFGPISHLLIQMRSEGK